MFFVVLFIYYFTRHYNTKSLKSIRMPDYMFALTRTPYLILDRAGNCVMASESALSFFQIEAENVNSFNITDLLEFKTEFKKPSVSKSDNTVFQYDVVCRRTQADCLINIVYIYDKYDEFIILVAHILDQSEKIKVQEKLIREKTQAEEASLAKSLFLAKMSHEIRTPMNAITGMSKLILREEVSPTVLNYAMNIKQASANLLAIINDVLDFSKIESGRMDIVARKYDLGSLLNDVISIIRMRLAEKSLLFIVNIDSCLPVLLEGDETRIRQILINLLSNAVKFTNSGHVGLTVTGKPSGEDYFELTFTVNDTGIGIKSENLSRLFTDFSQFDTRSPKAEGTGLGLSIARSLCQAMKGDIRVASEYGEGSTFTATVIQKVIDRSLVAAVDNIEDIRILIYETRPLYTRSLAKSVNNLGLPCSTATNRLAFLAEMKTHKFSHIFAASGLFEPNLLDDINTISPQASLVLMVDLGEPNNRANLPSLTMPLHSISIAHFLNQALDYWSEDEVFSQFTAPSARVLIVDDLPTNLTVTEGLLAPFQMKIDCCGSGQEALHLIRLKAYDLVLMDHMMPEMDGVEVTQKIRQLPGQQYQTLPIVALTANAVSGMREMFLENGFNDFLSKPIDISRLNEVVEKWLPRNKKVTGKKNPAHGQNHFDGRIDGLDTNLGLALTGGKIEEYRVLLEKFCRDAVHRLDLFRKVPDPDRLMDFAAEIQVLHTALANLGAASLAGDLDLLLSAAQRGNLAAIANNMEEFHEKLAALVEKIWAYLAI
ncbi:MAG: response regulator [Deltaproteobacteria bacterium]|nr:response regulator [Deltaproteobacteria bacterium]